MIFMTRTWGNGGTDLEMLAGLIEPKKHAECLLPFNVFISPQFNIPAAFCFETTAFDS